jgi:hypothetical protein
MRTADRRTFHVVTWINLAIISLLASACLRYFGWPGASFAALCLYAAWQLHREFREICESDGD